MSCGKFRYPDEISAKLALAKIQRQDKPHRVKQEQRAYHCQGCKAWHLTSYT